MNTLPSFGCVLLLIAGCGASATPAQEPQPMPAALKAVSEDANPKPVSTAPDIGNGSTTFSSVPSSCESGQADGVCAPPRTFVKWMCAGYPRPGVALQVFTKSSPFTRVYLNRNVEGWYSSGQQSTSAKLIFDEEVIVLSHPQGGRGGMVVGQGGAPYDVLRLDGVCSTLEPELVSLKRPPSPKHANVPWQHLDAAVRDALLQDSTVSRAESARRKECKGTTNLGVINAACGKADDRLSSAIAAFVANGGVVPMPTSR